MGLTSGTNSSGTKSRNLLPIGRYMVTIEHVEKTLAPTGTPRLSFTFRVEAGENTDRKIFDEVYLSKKALWKFDDICDAVGIPKGTDIDPNDPAVLINTFAGKSLFLRYSRDDYEKDGEEREGRKVTEYDSLEASVPRTRETIDTSGQQSDETPGENAVPIVVTTGTDAADGEVPF